MAREKAILPDGRRKERDIVRHPGGSAIVAVDASARVCLLRQWRHAAGGWIWEVPAGRHDVEGETHLALAGRELAEEAGLAASEWVPLGEVLSSPGFCDERLHLFLAREITAVPTAHGPGEFIEIHFLPFDEALLMAEDGRITDAKTIAALFRASHHLRGRP